MGGRNKNLIGRLCIFLKYFVDFFASYLGHFLRTFAQLLFNFVQRNLNKIDVYILNTMYELVVLHDGASYLLFSLLII